MQIRRVLTVCIALAWVATASPTLLAQNQNNRREAEKRTKQQEQDVEALLKLTDATTAGTQPAPAQIPITWHSNHFMRGADGTVFTPITLQVDRSALAAPGTALYLRVVNKDAPAAAAAPPPAGNDRNRAQPAPSAYAWENVYFFDMPADGRVQRALTLKPGRYEVIVAAKERTPESRPRNAPPLKVGMLRHELTVPDLYAGDLQTSSIIIANAIESVPAPLTPAQQIEQPYTFGAMRVVPSEDQKVKKSGELQVLFWVYGAADEAGKPNLLIEYNFHQKTGDAEKYFNKTSPQEVNAKTLPPDFSTTAGHQIPGNLVVPVASFPEGDYRVEIKITDKVSGKTLTQNANFSVVAG